jgi:hypothetical protein
LGSADWTLRDRLARPAASFAGARRGYLTVATFDLIASATVTGSVPAAVHGSDQKEIGSY